MMEKKYKYFEVRIWGPQAMFTDPLTRTSGEKISYPIPVYSALKGILESVFFNPSIQWIIDECRVLKPIKLESEWFLDRYRKDRVLYNYLTDCEYQVKAHMVPNYPVYKIEELIDLSTCIKLVTAALKVGGRRYAYFGTRECPANVEYQSFGAGNGYYDNTGVQQFELMFYAFEYPEHNRQNELKVRFWRPKMIDGIIHFCSKGECDYVRTIRCGKPYSPQEKKARGYKNDYILTI